MSNWLYEQRRSWANEQIRQRRRGLLSPERIQKLDSEGFEWDVVNTATVNKARLLEMARNGEPRPKKAEPLARALINYICKNYPSYDPVFDKEIRRLAPQWWEDTAAIKKDQLLEMARNGESRPNHKSPDPSISELGGGLNGYTCKSSSSYDPDFDHEIRKLAPHWMDKVAVKKSKLLEMARSGESRPKSGTSLGGALSRFVIKSSKGGAYDPDFDKEIRRLAPQWFRGSDCVEAHDE